MLGWKSESAVVITVVVEKSAVLRKAGGAEVDVREDQHPRRPVRRYQSGTRRITPWNLHIIANCDTVVF